MRIAALAVLLLALAGSSASGRSQQSCPRDPALGSVAFVRGGKLHEVSLGDCRVRLIRGSLRMQRHVPRDVLVRGRALWLRRGSRLIRLTRPLPMSGGLTQTPAPVSASPDGHFLVWRAVITSGSITADGLPLFVTHLAPRGKTALLAQRALAYDDYAAWCGSTLVYVAGADRIATNSKRLTISSPPSWTRRLLWRDSKRAFGSVTCATDEQSVAVLSQPARDTGSFFATRWQLWRVGLDGSHRLIDRPLPGFADESQHWSPDGRSLLFVRERQGHGSLTLWHDGRVFGPIASLGYSLGFYGHHDWPIAWRR